jgi:hypothetical protein
MIRRSEAKGLAKELAFASDELGLRENSQLSPGGWEPGQPGRSRGPSLGP